MRGDSFLLLQNPKSCRAVIPIMFAHQVLIQVVNVHRQFVNFIILLWIYKKCATYVANIKKSYKLKNCFKTNKELFPYKCSFMRFAPPIILRASIFALFCQFHFNTINIEQNEDWNKTIIFWNNLLCALIIKMPNFASTSNIEELYRKKIRDKIKNHKIIRIN